MEQIITDDKYIDHETHDEYLEDCSTCFSERQGKWTDRPDYQSNGEPSE